MQKRKKTKFKLKGNTILKEKQTWVHQKKKVTQVDLRKVFSLKLTTHSDFFSLMSKQKYVQSR